MEECKICTELFDRQALKKSLADYSIILSIKAGNLDQQAPRKSLTEASDNNGDS